jgi:NAD(P)-dependent dehydrogenase (short-subunit alcohol dehydrogenase family)
VDPASQNGAHPGLYSADAFRDKVAWVTGGSRGLGLSIAQALSAAGASVAISSRDARLVAEVVATLGDRALGLPLDISEPDAVEAAVARLVEEHGRLDIAVAAAGISPVLTKAENLELDVWRRILDVNLSGTFYTLRAAARPMLASGSGILVAVSSALGRVGTPGLSAYCASKGGVEQLVRALALEWGERGVRVNAVAPGWVDTEMTTGLQQSERLYAQALATSTMGRFARPDEIVGAVLFLLSEGSSYVTGTSISIDGGWTAG